MATYEQIHDLIGSTTLTPLRKKIRVAITIKAQKIADSVTPSETAKTWARQAVASPNGYEAHVLNYLLAKHNDLTIAQIEGATDATVQTGVNEAVDKLLGV